MTIIPNNRLIFFFGVVCFPLTLLAVAMPEFSIISYGLICVFVFVAVADALLSVKVLNSVEVIFPEIIRMSKGKETDILLIIKANNTINRNLKIGISFPETLFSKTYEVNINTVHPEACSYLWPVTGLKQGRTTLDKCYLEKKSPVGLWFRRTIHEIKCELRVYPNLFSEQKTLAAIFTNNGLGVHAQRLVGKGREFEKLREYAPGDSYEDIHWKATAKRGLPVSKVYQIERTQDIYLMIDASRMSARNAGIVSGGRLYDEKRSEKNRTELFSEDTLLDRYITASLTIGMAAEKQGDNFGIGVFSDRVSRFIKAKNGKAHYSTCRDMLYTVQPHRVSPDFSEFFTFVGTKIRKRSLLIVLTSLDDPVLSESFMKSVEILSRRHLVMVGMLKPAMANPVFSGDVKSVNGIYQSLSGHLLWNTLREMKRSLYRHGIGFSLLDDKQMSIQLISNYIDIKQRQLL